MFVTSSWKKHTEAVCERRKKVLSYGRFLKIEWKVVKENMGKMWEYMLNNSCVMKLINYENVSTH